MRKISAIGVVGSLLLSTPAFAITITPSFDALGLANTLFLNQSGITVNSATISGASNQAGTYTNGTGTYGLPNTGIVLSSGNVADYADGPNNNSGNSGSGLADATQAQNDLLSPITGQLDHFDAVQLDISFDVASEISSVTFFGAFGSEEFPEYVNSGVNDGFGLFVNGTNVAGVQSPSTGTNLPVNIDHPDFANITGTELDGMLAPNGNPVLRFDVPVNPGATNDFSIILADAGDSILDTTVYLSSFGASTPNEEERGETEFNPILPSNPPDPITGEFVIELEVVEAEVVVWVDPPVAVGYTYEADSGEFFSLVAPSLATVPDLDGYLVTVGGTTVSLAAGASLNFFDMFGENPSSFTVSGIDPDIELDPFNPLAFPLGVSFVASAFDVNIDVTPTIVNTGDPNVVPLPANFLLLTSGMLGLGAMRRRQKRSSTT